MAIKLVIVDDAPFIREVLRHIFNGTEIDVVGEAFDGDAAVSLVKRVVPDVVLMDLVMPNKSGIEATAEILKAEPGVKIIACSTIDQNAMMMRALEAGCCHYLTKPFKSNDVLQAVRKAAESQSKEGRS